MLIHQIYDVRETIGNARQRLAIAERRIMDASDAHANMKLVTADNLRQETLQDLRDLLSYLEDRLL